jgi:hypothetical protein
MVVARPYSNVIELFMKFLARPAKASKNRYIVKTYYFVQNLFNKVLKLSKKSA